MCFPSLSCLHGNQWGAGEGIFLPNEAATCCGSCRRNSVSREQRGHNHRHQRHPPEQNTGRGTGGRRDLHIWPEKWKRRDGYLTGLSSQVHSWLKNMGSHTTTCNNTTHKANCILNSIYRGCVRPMVQEHMSSTLSIHLTCGVCTCPPEGLGSWKTSEWHLSHWLQSPGKPGTTSPTQQTTPHVAPPHLISSAFYHILHKLAVNEQCKINDSI